MLRHGAAGAATGDLGAWTGDGTVVPVTGRVGGVRFGSLPGGGPQYTGDGWCAPGGTGYAPTEADAALVGVLADHATAVVHRERTTARVADPAPPARWGWRWAAPSGSPPRPAS